MRLRDRIRGWFWLPERALVLSIVLLLSRAHDSYESVCVRVYSCDVTRIPRYGAGNVRGALIFRL